MKLLSDILSKNYGKFMAEGNLPSFEAGDLVCAIMKNSFPQYINIQQHENITCPMCGSPNGYKVRNGKELWLACRRRECIEKNSRKQRYQPGKKINLTEIMIKSGVPNRLINASFADWKHQEGLKGEIINFVRKSKETLVIIGKNGTGKSYASVAAMREFYEATGNIPRFYNISDLYQIWLDENPSPIELTDKLTRQSMLVLDDLGTRVPTEGFHDYLYMIINSRYSSMNKTIVTTNLDNQQLVDKFGEAITSRLFSGVSLMMDGDDRRMLKD